MSTHRGLIQQIRKNNQLSILLLLGFPTLLVTSLFAVLYFSRTEGVSVIPVFLKLLPIVLAISGVWLLIAYFGHAKMIEYSTGAAPLERKEHIRVYNLTENLCISQGMVMPKLFVIESNGLNAFASGINDRTFSVTLTSGIIAALDDDELEGVIAHELMHIRNKDVRLLIISIVFVGIFSFLTNILFRSILYGGGRRRSKDDEGGGGGNLVIIALIVSILAYLLSILFKLALSRKREYLADAGAAEMTRKPEALASALRKISGRSEISSVSSDDVKQLYIHNLEIGSLFATHPPIEKRIEFLEQA